VCYRAAFSVEKMRYRVWNESRDEELFFENHKEMREYCNSCDDDRVWVDKQKVVEPLENALQNTNSLMHKLTEGFKYEAYLTGQGNFRHALATIKKYKGNRDETEKPKYYHEVREHLARRWGAKVVDGMEADDEISIRAHELAKQGKQPCVVSNDKDMRMIPAIHYDFTKDLYFEIGKEEAWRNFYMQCLMGDSTDNIPGLPDVGPKTAAKILANAKGKGEMLEAVKKEWQNRYPDGYPRDDGSLITADAAMKEVASLLWLKRTRE